ncbi:DUF3105 domain-containing protein [Actinomadura alba]|uniref:DUF3105 domain-containing protein n=1 Tax=Actinomadura alba TaxID=406431 RepID=UPI0031DA1F3D
MAKSRSARRASEREAKASGPNRAGQKSHLKKSTPWGTIAFYGAIGAVAIGAVTFAALQTDSSDVDVSGVQEVKNVESGHTKADVTYKESPPVGGPHDETWQNCGAYDAPLRDENAVHSLEHGAVWITYRPDLSADQVTKLRSKAPAGSYVLVSPYPALTEPIALSSWGFQLKVKSADDERVDAFLRKYVQGERTPEPGAPCTGGKATP